MRLVPTVAFAILLATAVAAGCGGSQRKEGASASVVTETVTLSGPATKPHHVKPRPAAAQAVAPSYTTFTGSYFSVDYPDDWTIDANEVSKGSYFDTTIQSSSRLAMLRVDVTPPSGGAGSDASSNAVLVERALSGQPGYQELRFGPTTFRGYPAVDWEFVVREQGILLHKQDTFFNDDSGNDIAILTQAPTSQFRQWHSAFAHMRQSLLVATATVPSSPPQPTPAPAADFCAAHSCIPSFYDGTGYIVQCNDGMWSHSGGVSGACSYHGGES
jgi:hypothetical protein